MTESSHDLVAAKATRIWEILRIVRVKRTEPASVSAQPSTANDGYLKSTWDS
jgi:hypothetical protein